MFLINLFSTLATTESKATWAADKRYEDMGRFDQVMTSVCRFFRLIE